MTFIPNQELHAQDRLNLAPMIDFLFLILMFFASLAVSRVATRDSEIDLVKVRAESRSAVAQNEVKTILLSIMADGSYKWMTEMRDYSMPSIEEVTRELNTQYLQGVLPSDKSKTHVLLRIDKKAPWEPIMKLVFAIREQGFEAHPVYEPEVEGT